MPKIQVGRIVYHFPCADLGAAPRPSIVMKVGQRGITLRSQAPDTWNETMMSVHHVTDPLLKYRPNVRREDGGWDYTEHDVWLHREINRLREVLREACLLISNIESGKDSATLTIKRQSLTARLRLYGVEFRKNATTDM